VAALEALRLQLASFEGPLPLLLHLIERNELAVTSVSVVEVADQFLALMPHPGATDMAATSEFISMAARLMLLKSRALLRMPLAAEVADQVDNADAEDLARQIRLYRQFQDAAHWLAARQEAGFHCRPKPIAVTLPATPVLPTVQVSVLRERARILAHGSRTLESPTGIWPDVSFVEVRTALLQRVRQLGCTLFVQLAADARHPLVTITLFLAMLDAVRSRLLVAEQDVPFGPIRVSPGTALVQ
jgi:segregation and condensation protein A